MPTTIKLIKNLTTKKEAPPAELTKFDIQAGFADTITAAGFTATAWADFAGDNDNIQVTWQDETEKLIARGVGGRFAIKEGKIVISGLKNASKYSAEVSGELAIGPKGDDKAAALLRVRIGNMVSDTNKSGDTIINFSDKTDSVAGGSEINLKVLIDWILESSKDKTSKPELPKIEDGNGGVKKPEDFVIVFKNFYYNITQNTFDFWVESKAGSEITFGNFTIKKAGFRVTNMAATAEVKEKPKALPAAEPAE
ncbi:hypothetical protein HNQ91_000578 [Filimonas zeae]|uniref:Uncharacterized protein n=1 Tax=Filimonas zeae TaxID=1737353 RepID=A0A917MRM7_9BACT|nr:hypothetical protein [Filimonas zeae]MDR6337556.1 hypothetical protein [Filimonas zeae]GGH59185.1 hypothetical protein GCM10011379_05690 [Filimonas zeae]